MKQELALPAEYHGALCELKTLSNDLLTTGVIQKIGEDFLEISNALGTSSIKFFVEEVKVIITHKKLPDRVFIGKLYIPNLKFFRVIDVQNVMNRDMRNFFRVNVYLPATIVVPNEDKEAKELTNTYEVNVIDLSLGGMYMTVDTYIAMGTQILISMQLDGHKFEVSAVIKRKRDLTNNQFGYGCAFIGLKNKNADIVVKYLFKKQKEVRA